MIRSTAVLAATNSDPNVAVSTVLHLLEYQWTGVAFKKWCIAVRAFAVTRSCGGLHPHNEWMCQIFPMVLGGHEVFCSTIDSSCPFIFLVWHVRVVRHTSTVPYGSMGQVCQIAKNSLSMSQMSNSWACQNLYMAMKDAAMSILPRPI